jgi:hypothetical protein
MKDKCNGNGKKNRTKGKGKGNAFKCHKCSGPNHFAKKYQTPHHLVELYQKSLKEANGAKILYETHFNDVSKETTASGTKEEDPKIPRTINKEDIDMENTIVKYNSNDVFRDLN